MSVQRSSKLLNVQGQRFIQKKNVVCFKSETATNLQHYQTVPEFRGESAYNSGEYGIPVLSRLYEKLRKLLKRLNRSK